MRLSIGAPQTGALATVDAVSTIATYAEERGLDGIWVVDRLLDPVAPRDPYPATADGVLSPQFERVLDPLQVLAFAAARTSRISLGTGVLVVPWYNPVTLGRSLATLDVLSEGRLQVGLGVGWSRDEHQAAGAPENPDGSRTDEFVDVLRQVWTDDVVSYAGAHYTVPASRIGLAPVQRPHPPLLFAAYAPGALRRIARVGDGWMPAGLPLEAMTAMWSMVLEMAAGFGRDPDDLRLVVRGTIGSTERLGSDRPMFCGDASQIADDVRRCQEIGASEVILDAQFTSASADLSRFVGVLDDIVEHACQEVGQPA